MKITIDTKEDSHDDLKRLIKLLSEIVHGTKHNIGIFDSDPSPEQTDTSGLMSMFSSDGTQQVSTVANEDKEETKEPDETPSVELY